MISPPAERLVRAYRQRLEAVRREIARQVEELYGDVDPNAIQASIIAFIAKAGPVLEVGQQSAAALAAAFMRTFTLSRTGQLVDLVEDDSIPGTRADGTSIAEGMAPFGSMILARLADGADLTEALAFGLYLATRYADGELTSAVDRTVELQSRDRFQSWEGIVADGACDRCQANDGVHDLDVEIYRHPGCFCTYVPLIEAAT